MQHFLRASKVAEPHANLAERGERDSEAVPRAVRFVKRDAAFGERQRLVVAVLEREHVGLVADTPSPPHRLPGRATASRSACRSAAIASP